MKTGTGNCEPNAISPYPKLSHYPKIFPNDISVKLLVIIYSQRLPEVSSINIIVHSIFPTIYYIFAESVSTTVSTDHHNQNDLCYQRSALLTKNQQPVSNRLEINFFFATH